MRILATFLLSVILISACQKGDQGPAGPALEGSIHGFVYLFNENGSRLANHGGVTVTVGAQGPSAISDSLGKWMIQGLTTGIYSMTYSKSGYGTWKEPTVQFSGGGDYYSGVISLYQLPSIAVLTFAVDTTTSGLTRLILSGTISQTDGQVVVFFHTSPDVSSEPTDNIYTYATSTYNNSATFNAGVSVYQLNRAGIFSGMTLYLKAYPSSVSFSNFSDPSTGRPVYPNIGSIGSSVVSVTVP